MNPDLQEKVIHELKNIGALTIAQRHNYAFCKSSSIKNYNPMNAKTMATIKFTVAGILIITTCFWMVKSKPFELQDYGILGVLMIVIAIPIYSGIQALKNAVAGLNPTDELSKTIQVHAAAKAFRISIFVWLMTLTALDFFDIDTVNKAKLVIAIGMVITFFIYLMIRFYLSKVGIFDDNKD